MTPLPTKERLERRQLYDPVPGSVTAKDLVQMEFRKKKHLSDWAVGALLLAIQNGEITKVKADLFQTVFVRGAKPRKTRVHAGEPFLGPGGELMTIAGIEYAGHLTNAQTRVLPRLAMEAVGAHPNYRTWIDALFQGVVPEGAWVGGEEGSDSPDEVDDEEGAESSSAVARTRPILILKGPRPVPTSNQASPPVNPGLDVASGPSKSGLESSNFVDSFHDDPAPQPHPTTGGKKISPEMQASMMAASAVLHTAANGSLSPASSALSSLTPSPEPTTSFTPVAKGRGLSADGVEDSRRPRLGNKTKKVKKSKVIRVYLRISMEKRWSASDYIELEDICNTDSNNILTLSDPCDA